MQFVSIPVAVHNRHFEWQLDLFWYQHKRLYGSEAYQKARAIIIKRNYPNEVKVETLQWEIDIPHFMAEGHFDFNANYNHQYCLPMNIQVGLWQLLQSNTFPDDTVLEVLDCDMFHLRPHPTIQVNEGELYVDTIYEDWHLKSLSDNRSIIDIYFENGGGYYNGGFVPIIGTVATFKRILPEWIAVHNDIVQRDYDHTIKWWAGMFALQAACEKAKVKMNTFNYCFIQRANSLADHHYIAHYSIDGDFIHKKDPGNTLSRPNAQRCLNASPALLLYTKPFAEWLLQSRFMNTDTIQQFNQLPQLLAGLQAIEFGGPSPIFSELGIYPVLDNCDGVNFTTNPSLNTGQPSGTYIYYEQKVGQFWWCDATDLYLFTDNSYNLALSSDNLEHIANPIRALNEWKRVIRPNGFIFLSLPRKESNFDHQRPDTTFEHILDDFNGNVDETDLTHLEEILALHDLERDPFAKPREHFEQRSRDNFNNRCLHHHIFSTELIQKLFDYMGFESVLITHNYTNYFALARVKK